ncbi:uncharacterized protein LOC133920579 isoform X2 [Phragmites australis]|uniref:uncharacterized protein LOC133920579 isoform X2 n=1 Tax=Phragmites australis TaxID=29695 RepID=UPI002D774147|nr:uncharacterized protein LOC133920579 isoform X2 [Phragmites australis]
MYFRGYDNVVDAYPPQGLLNEILTGEEWVLKTSVTKISSLLNVCCLQVMVLWLFIVPYSLVTARLFLVHVMAHGMDAPGQPAMQQDVFSAVFNLVSREDGKNNKGATQGTYQILPKCVV